MTCVLSLPEEDRSDLAVKVRRRVPQQAKDAEFKEADHPRDNDGQFTEAGGGGGKAEEDWHHRTSRATRYKHAEHEAAAEASREKWDAMSPAQQKKWFAANPGKARVLARKNRPPHDTPYRLLARPSGKFVVQLEHEHYGGSEDPYFSYHWKKVGDEYANRETAEKHFNQRTDLGEVRKEEAAKQAERKAKEQERQDKWEAERPKREAAEAVRQGERTKKEEAMPDNLKQLKSVLAKLPDEGKKSFAQSLIDTFVEKGGLTPGQQPWVQRLIDLAEHGVEKDPEIQKQAEELHGIKGRLTGRDLEAAESMIEQFNSRGTLSDRQQSYFESLLRKARKAKGAQDMAMDESVTALKQFLLTGLSQLALDAEFKKEQHPRGGDPKHSGRFSKGHGSGGKPEGGGEKPAETKPEPAGKTNGQAGQQQQQAQPQQQPGQQQQQQPAARGAHPGHGYSSASQVINGVIHTTNINDATRALYEGKKVALQQPRQVSTLVARLANIAKRFEQMGGKAPNFDLCNVSVPGTNLFCADTKGIPRVQMPQLPDEKGPAFTKFLTDKGYKTTQGTEKASFLRATQSELVGVKVSGIMGYFRTKDASTDPPLFVSKDNYIVDGHHRWAARVGLDAENNQLGQTDVNIVRVDLPIIELLAEAETFTEGKGHKAATAHDKRWSSPRFGARDAFTPQHRPAGSRTGGQFTSQGGGAGKTSGGPIHASAAAWTGRANRPGSAPGGLGPTATKAAEATKRGIKGLTQEDYETFKKNLPSRQKTLSENLNGMSKVLPQLLKAHGREEAQKAKHAVGALTSMARGMRPTPEQSKGLRQFAVSMMLSVGMFVTTGDPTGTLAHGATAVAMHLGQEYAQHAVLEHGAQAVGGAARYAYHAATGGGDAAMDDFSPEEIKLLQGFMATLAKTVATHQIPDQRLAELFKQGDTSQDTAMDTAFRSWASPRFGPPYRRLAMDRALAMDKSPFTPLRSQRDRIAMDRAPSVRSMNEDGDLRVALSNISKATVNPYWGKEIPNCEGLGLDPERKYMLLRHPKELAKAAGTFNGLPILAEHQPRTSTDHPSDLVVGSTGTDAVYRHPYLMNSLVFWTKPAVDAIANNEQKELSCAYHYEPVMTPGVYEGQRYDGIMTKIRGNHVALVKDGRAGADVVVQDSALKEMHYA